MFKKILMLITAFLLVGSFAYSQDSNTEALTLSATLESGCVLSLDIGAVTWANIPVPESNFETIWISADEGVITLDIYGRYESGQGASHRPRLLLETVDFFLNGNPMTQSNELVKFIFTGDIVAEEMAAVPGSNRVLWDGLTSSFAVHTEMDIQFANTLTRWPGAWTGSFTLVVMDIVI